MNRPLVEERVRVGWYSAFAAVAAGIAAATATAKDKVDSLIGTVASVALVPAVGAAGIAVISGAWMRALGGVTLLLVNVLLIVGMGLIALALWPDPKHD